MYILLYIIELYIVVLCVYIIVMRIHMCLLSYITHLIISEHAAILHYTNTTIIHYTLLYIYTYYYYNNYRKECEELELDERNIKAKISRKQEEYERLEKRVRSVDHVRPQFMEEVCVLYIVVCIIYCFVWCSLLKRIYEQYAVSICCVYCSI